MQTSDCTNKGIIGNSYGGEVKGVRGDTRGIGFRLGGRGSGFQAKHQSARTSIVGGGKSTLEGPEMEKSRELHRTLQRLSLAAPPPHEP